jgi:hypothetical protein
MPTAILIREDTASGAAEKTNFATAGECMGLKPSCVVWADAALKAPLFHGCAGLLWCCLGAALSRNLLCGTVAAAPFPVGVGANIAICVSGALGELHGSFVGSRPLSRAAPLPQDDNAIKAG